MNHWMIRLLLICLSAAPLLAGCQSNAETLLPVTGQEEVALAAPAVQARDSVLAHIASSSRLGSQLPGTGWELEAGANAQEYRFRNGAWLMLVRLADAGQANRRVLLINRAEQISWTGYIRPDGRVIDTSYGR